jgi:glycogen synthase
MDHALRVLYVSPESLPLAKASGLAETAQALAAALERQGLGISLVLPMYRRPEIEARAMDLVIPEFLVPIGTDRVKASVSRDENAEIPFYFIDHPKYFCRDAFWVIPNGTDEKTWDSAGAIYVQLYENALKSKRGGRHG